MRLYLLIGVALAFAALFGYAMWERGNAASAYTKQVKAENEAAGLRIDLQAAEKINKGNIETINKMTAQRLANEAILLKLSESVASINEAATNLNSEVEELGRTNETVNSYLDTLVPDDLKRVYEQRR